jgi:hypothetical protein
MQVEAEEWPTRPDGVPASVADLKTQWRRVMPCAVLEILAPGRVFRWGGHVNAEFIFALQTNNLTLFSAPS